MVSLGRWLCHLCLVVLFALTIHSAAMGDDWPPITPEERGTTSLPEQPGAAAVVLDREEVSDDPHNYRTVYMRIKVLTEPGRRYADVEIPYSRRHFTISDVRGRTVHRDGTIVPSTGKPFDKVLVRRKERGQEERYQVKSFCRFSSFTMYASCSRSSVNAAFAEFLAHGFLANFSQSPNSVLEKHPRERGVGRPGRSCDEKR